MKSRVQSIAEKINMTYDEFIGEMRKCGCSIPTAAKIWRGEYEKYNDFKDNDINLSNLRKAAYVLRVGTPLLIPSEDHAQEKAAPNFETDWQRVLVHPVIETGEQV